MTKTQWEQVMDLLRTFKRRGFDIHFSHEGLEGQVVALPMKADFFVLGEEVDFSMAVHRLVPKRRFSNLEELRRSFTVKAPLIRFEQYVKGQTQSEKVSEEIWNFAYDKAVEDMLDVLTIFRVVKHNISNETILEILRRVRLGKLISLRNCIERMIEEKRDFKT